MAITSPTAGAYTGTLNPAGGGATALGYTRQGYNLHFVQKGERVEETDLYGLSLFDVVGRGAARTIDAIFRVYAAITRDALFPWAGAFGRVYNAANPLGTLASVTPDAIVLTAVANTPAASNGPATLTCPVVILSPDNDLSLVLNSTVRDVPLKWDVLLSDSGGVGTLFTTS